MRDSKLGAKLKARRKERGLTLAELSALTGVEKSYLGRIEKGQRFASGLVLRKLAQPLGFEEAEIMKLAGVLSPDKTDERIARFKESLKGEIKGAMANLLEKVESL